MAFLFFPPVKDVVIVSQPNPVLSPDSSQASTDEAPMEAAQGESVDRLQILDELITNKYIS